MTKSRWIIAGLIVAGVGFATFQGLRPRPPPPVEVTTSAAKKGAITRTVTAAGHLQAHETVKVSSNISGDLLSLAVKEGEQVRKGQVLGQIDRRLQESQVAQFRAGVANARAAIERNDVRGNGLRGIAITEMSMAEVWGNRVVGNADVGIYAVDMSMADIYANRISVVLSGPLGDAHCIRAEFHAEVMLDRNQLDCAPSQAVVTRSEATVELHALP